MGIQRQIDQSTAELEKDWGSGGSGLRAFSENVRGGWVQGKRDETFLGKGGGASCHPR